MEAESLRNHRQTLCLTQFEVAVASGLSLPTIQRVETGKAFNLTGMTKRKLAKGYGLTIAQLDNLLNPAAILTNVESGSALAQAS
jgi:transcriptional regulator with XRE-family HTH domain